MDIPMTLPLDDGYLRRECPTCKRQFKWHHGPTDDSEDTNGSSTEEYFCPYCGQGAPTDSWWTEDQLRHAQELAVGESAKIINDSMKGLERKMRKGPVSFKANSMPMHEPHPLHEPQDMVVVQSPCHPEEPIKITEDWQEPLHCLVCGSTFAI